MAISIPLDKMTLEEKLQVMESIWDDLCSRAGDFPSPSWHGETLRDREAALEGGEEEVEDWEVAKTRIKNDLL